jgi:uncharacterized protein YhaN
MKISRLDLSAYGSLRAVTLELSIEPRLHVIYGPNEAGKSTALRAISGLFYGIPENTSDVHTFRGPDLRIGALVCDARGRELYVVRRKGRKNTLRAADGEPLPGAEASWLSAGVAESTFHALFGLSFASLQGGAEELLGSAGDLGQSLFAAAFGGGRVRNVLAALDAEADGLFRPRGRLQRLNEALNEYEAAKKKSHEQAQKIGAFAEQQDAIGAAERESAQLERERQRLRGQRARLERAQRVLPLLAQQRELSRQREGLGVLQPLAADAAERRRRAEVLASEAQLRREVGQAELARLERELSGLARQPRLAALEPQLIEQLQERLSSYRRGARELPRLGEALARARDEVERALVQLGLSRSGLDLERLRLPKALAARAREQLRVTQQLASQAATLVRTRAQKRDELEQQRRQLALLWNAEPKLQLPGITRASLPHEQRVSEFEQQFLELAESARRLSERRTEALAELERNRRDREALALSGAPPSEAELSEVRATRQACFRELGALFALSAAEPLPASAGELFERAQLLTEQADRLADRLRWEAQRVAEQARLQAEHESGQRGLQRLAAEEQALERRRTAQLRAWQGLFERLGIPVRSPREVLQLLGEQRSNEVHCQQLELELERCSRELRECEQRKAEATEAWRAVASELLGNLPLTAAESAAVGGAGRDIPPPQAAELEAILDGRAELLQRWDDARQLAVELAELERELGAFEQDARALGAAHEQDARALGAAHEQDARALGAAHEQDASALGAAHEQDASGLCAAHERDAGGLGAGHERDARDLGAAHERTSERLTPEQAAARLISGWREAQAAELAHQQLMAAKVARTGELAQAELALAHAERELGALMRAAGVGDLASLQAAEERTAQARTLDAELTKLQPELLSATDGLPVDDVVSAAEACIVELRAGRELDPAPDQTRAEAGGPSARPAAVGCSLDEVRTQLAILDDALESLDQRRQEVAHTLARCRAGLERLRESHGAGDAALEAASQLESARGLTQRYIQVRLAASVLRREIERYRERHRAPILRYAADLFARLTLDAYSGLDVDHGPDDQPVIRCLRASGERVEVAALSSGTRDQLYLALRLASIAHLDEQRELMPLVLDDVLVHFDDDRARAALGVLGAFAATTQVLFFTHHQRLAELASEAVPIQQLRLHRLESSRDAQIAAGPRLNQV